METSPGYWDPILWRIAKGEQNTQSPLANYWSSNQSGTPNGATRMWTGLRDANVFLENIHKPFDLYDYEREQWIAEVKFLKAYFHYFLLRMYGPIPIVKENTPMYASPEEVQVYRQPVDSVASYIVQLLDEAIPSLPMNVNDIFRDLGRATKPMALALKAKVLTLIASPLFNGNPDYANFVDNRNINLFPKEYKAEKWEQAAKALKEAITVAHEAGHELYDYHEGAFSKNLHDSTILAMNVRAAVVERWNDEIIWGDGRGGTVHLQNQAFFGVYSKLGVNMIYAVPLRIVEQFYSKNGVPIDEDKDWVGVDWYGLRKGDRAHSRFVREGFTTINLHFNREYRFYGSISFDGGLYYGAGKISKDRDFHLTPYRALMQPAGFYSTNHSVTGYMPSKVVHYMTTQVPNSNAQYYDYSWPIIRLADLYLMYAEALNETKSRPDAEVYEYIDKVRKRSGLEGVLDSWRLHSTNPDKPLNKEGMREIIQNERLNELAFEGHRFWDLRRWKLAEHYMNQPIRGWTARGTAPEEFYIMRDIYKLKFDKKDYLWPIQTSEILKNKNLVQNPGW
jgi:hypothetical protein